MLWNEHEHLNMTSSVNLLIVLCTSTALPLLAVTDHLLYVREKGRGKRGVGEKRKGYVRRERGKGKREREGSREESGRLECEVEYIVPTSNISAHSL